MVDQQKNDFEIFEQVINSTYPGIALLARDTDLGTLISKYKKGIILKEKGFIDSSKIIGGMITQHRFAILSNHYTDLTDYEHDNKRGLCILKAGSRFKVLDQYTSDGKTQITLLHLPEQGWEMFENFENDLDVQLIRETRTIFSKSIHHAPFPELTTRLWLDRCRFPIGMDDKGNYFD